MNFSYYNPTKIYFGKDCLNAHPEVFRTYGRKAFIVTGRHSARTNGSLDAVCSVLKQQNLSWCIFDKTVTNPTIPSVREGLDLLKQENADFVIGIGGGSPMDTAKAIAFLANQEIPDEKLFDRSCYQDKALPLLMVPTTSGTGSEVTEYAVLMNDETKSKSSISTPYLYPKAAFLDPSFTLQVNTPTTRWTAIDALSHSVEGILSQKGDPMITAMALSGIAAFGRCRKALAQGKFSYQDREELMYCSLLGGLVLAHTSTTAVHAMGYSLTYYKGIPHGRANGLCLGGYLRLTETVYPDPVKRILAALDMNDSQEFQAYLDMLLGEREAITKEEIERYSREVYIRRNIPNSLLPPTREQIAQIFREGFHI
ncbi:iron-containing alcohol dehydrogenase family protein [Hominifimenecus sp. rT4P-3]|uniref:iron-containing alcohol dehydrogenase family protein n=1 Tax=Hominifimenecus sp. rT4P-3 TaxID=3242979 RepID=UPI003DA3D826